MSVIETKDLILRPYRKDDVKQAHDNFLSQKETAKYTLWRPTDTVEEAELKLDYWKECMKNGFFWLIEEKDSHQVIGFVAADKIDDGVYGNVGIAIGTGYINKGYGSQCLAILIDEIRKIGAKEIHYSHFKENEASKNLALKHGFVYYKSGSRVRKYDNKTFEEIFYILKLN